MKMLSVDQVAEKWNLSPRTIQNLCKNGRIQGAVNFGKSWMIPENAKRPADGRRKKEVKKYSLLYQTPFMDMTKLYTEPGTADQCVESLSDSPETQMLFSAEIAYSRGNIEQVYKYANFFLENHNDFYAMISSGMLLSLCAMWKGDVQLWYKARRHVVEAPCNNETDRDILALTLAAMDSAIRNTNDFPDWFKRGSFDNLPKDAHPAAWVYYIKYLLVLAQDMAVSNMEFNDVRGMGLLKTLPNIMEPMISQMVSEKIVMAEIYLRLLCSISYRQAGDDVFAGKHLDKAIQMCLADGLYGPLVEHRRQLGMFLDDHIAMFDPSALRIVKDMHKELHTGWTILHNAVTERTVSASLTIREREVARLAAFGLSDKQISKQLNISESSVKVLVRSAKTKTNVMKRVELALYI